MGRRDCKSLNKKVALLAPALYIFGVMKVLESFITKIFAFLIVCTIGTAEMGYSATWYQTIFHLAAESHEEWNPDREDFPAGFQVGAHHHHDASESDDCGDSDHHSANFHLNELAGSVLVSVAPPASSASIKPFPLREARISITPQLLSDQGHLSNLFRPPIA